MFEKMDDAEVIGGEILGGKTGYTTQAGLCLASLARLGGKEYILVTAKAEGGPADETISYFRCKECVCPDLHASDFTFYGVAFM